MFQVTLTQRQKTINALTQWLARHVAPGHLVIHTYQKANYSTIQQFLSILLKRPNILLSNSDYLDFSKGQLYSTIQQFSLQSDQPYFSIIHIFSRLTKRQTTLLSNRFSINFSKGQPYSTIQIQQYQAKGDHSDLDNSVFIN